MGTIIQPVYSSCHEPYPRCLIGLGMLDMTNKILAPYACDHCGTISFKSLQNKHHRCSQCKKQVTLYGKTLCFMLPDDPDIHYEPEKVVIDVTVACDMQYVLEDKNYHCPKCKKETLRFQEVGLWD
jgi:ribosomal protein L37AE/L43A